MKERVIFLLFSFRVREMQLGIDETNIKRIIIII